jgi:hypothetical protein
MTGSGVTCRRAAAAVAAAQLACAAAAQQEQEIISSRPQLQWMSLSDIQAAISLEWRRDVDDHESIGGADEHDIQDRVWEILELSGKGYIGHPNILEFGAGGRFWLTQRWLEQQAPATKEYVGESLLDWDLSALILQQQVAPITVYTRRTTDDIDRPFAGTLENTITQSGVRMNVRSNRFPTTVEVYARQETQTDPFVGQDFNIDQYSAVADGRIEIDSSQYMWWNFSYDDVNESGQLQVPQSFERTTGDVTHTFNFGEDQRNELRSEISLYDQTGSGAYRQLRLFERLRLNHSPKLTSWYDVILENIDRPGLDGYTERASANVRHQLFDSLTTFARAGAVFNQIPSDNFTSDLFFTEVDFDYIKKAPYGRIDAGLTADFSVLDQSERGVSVPVNDNLFTFNAAGVIVISQRNIEPGSITITDVSGLIQYIPGFDFTVLELPDGVEIRRVPGGNIAPGQSVLVDYTIGPEAAGTTLTSGLGLDFRYTFDEGILRGLSVYTRVFWQDESRSFELAAQGQDDNDFTEYLYGAEYNIWRIFLLAEQRVHDSELSPFTATRMEARYVQELGKGSALVLGVLYQDIDRSDLDLRTATTTLSGQWNQQVTSRLRASLLVAWQDVDASPGVDSQAFDQEFEFNWTYNQMTIYGRIRNSFVDSDIDDTSFQTYVVGLRREF